MSQANVGPISVPGSRSLMAAILFVVVALVVIWPEPLVRLLAAGFYATPEKAAIAESLTRITFGYIGWVSLVALMGAVLNVEKRFAIVAKAEIYQLMRELTCEGLSILLISSELPEILGMSDRVMVMRGQRIEHVFCIGEAVTEEAIMSIAAGGHRDGS